MPSEYGPFPYSPISRRPAYRFPNQARVAVLVVPNIEFFPLSADVPPVAGRGKIPDVPSWGVRDYGNRIGLFRLIEVMDRYGIRGTAALNSAICTHHPAIIEDCLVRNWEFIGHNETNSARLNELPAGEEGALIRRTVAAIELATGAPPKGWLGAGLQETWQTLDHLTDCGIEYVADWCNDDQPYQMRLAAGRKIACVPYSFETNDKAAYENQHLTPDEFGAMIQRQFDVFYREGETQVRVLTIALHPYISGVAHRIDMLDRVFGYICRHDDVWLATGSELAAVARDL